MNTNIKINGCKLTINLSDMGFIGRMLTARKELEPLLPANTGSITTKSPEEQYKYLETCVEAIYKFFDSIFGAGTADKMFKRSRNVNDYEKALLDFTAEVEKADKAAQVRLRFRQKRRA